MSGSVGLPPLTAEDVASQRRTLVEWLRAHGAGYYTQMIRLGRQPIRPQGPAWPVGQVLAMQELMRLSEADLWFFDADLCALLAHAHAGMPRFAPVEQDLPSRWGFALFAEPIAARDPQHDPGLQQMLSETQIDAYGLDKIPVSVVGVSWGPLASQFRDGRTPAGGVWISFYAQSRIPLAEADPAHLRLAQTFLPPLIVENEAVVPWLPPGADEARYLLPRCTETGTTWGWAALLFAAFRLAGQANLTQDVVRPAPRAEHRRTQRAGLPDRPVHTVRLRHTERGSGQAGASTREYVHRWVVRGHWRQQPWGPGRAYRRPTWINPHPKGPAGAPLIGGERVNVASVISASTTRNDSGR